jgi:hypothetical protein
MPPMPPMPPRVEADRTKASASIFRKRVMAQTWVQIVAIHRRIRPVEKSARRV